MIEQISKWRKRKRLKDMLLRLEEADKEAFDFCLDTFLVESHVTRPRFLTGEALLRAEGRRTLAMSVLELISKDDPQYIINKLEQEQKQNERREQQLTQW